MMNVTVYFYPAKMPNVIELGIYRCAMMWFGNIDTETVHCTTRLIDNMTSAAATFESKKFGVDKTKIPTKVLGNHVWIGVKCEWPDNIYEMAVNKGSFRIFRIQTTIYGKDVELKLIKK